jgi:Domain of unknown function (DUF4280)
MGIPIGMGALLQCSFGVAPSALSVLPTSQVLGSTPLATIMDNVPMLNILPFGMCECPANPVVAAATAAALGVLTPMPCIPATAAPWAVGSPTVLVGGKPLLDNQSKLICSYGGMIQVTSPGQVGLTSA